jgi:hypothetical protein
MEGCKPRAKDATVRCRRRRRCRINTSGVLCWLLIHQGIARARSMVFLGNRQPNCLRSDERTSKQLAFIVCQFLRTSGVQRTQRARTIRTAFGEDAHGSLVGAAATYYCRYGLEHDRDVFPKRLVANVLQIHLRTVRVVSDLTPAIDLPVSS